MTLVHWDDVEKHIDDVINHGADGIVVTGTTGETSTLTDPEKIRRIIREGLEELGLKPHGRTLVKPNLVCAGELFEHAHTRPEFAEGVLLALRDRDDGAMTELLHLEEAKRVVAVAEAIG